MRGQSEVQSESQISGQIGTGQTRRSAGDGAATGRRRARCWLPAGPPRVADRDARGGGGATVPEASGRINVARRQWHALAGRPITIRLPHRPGASSQAVPHPLAHRPRRARPQAPSPPCSRGACSARRSRKRGASSAATRESCLQVRRSRSLLPRFSRPASRGASGTPVPRQAGRLKRLQSRCSGLSASPVPLHPCSAPEPDTARVQWHQTADATPELDLL